MGQPPQAARDGTDNTQLCSHRNFIEYFGTGATTCLQAEGSDLCHGNFFYGISPRELGGVVLLHQEIHTFVFPEVNFQWQYQHSLYRFFFTFSAADHEEGSFNHSIEVHLTATVSLPSPLGT